MLKLIMELGVGGNGTVILVGNEAIKTFHVERKDDEDYIPHIGIPAHFIREACVMRSCEHPNIIPCLDISIDHLLDNFTIKMPQGRGDLTKITDVDILEVLRDVASALYYLEQKNILYGDLKPENIIMFGNKAVLADFGLIRLEVNNVPHEELNTMSWKSPQDFAYLNDRKTIIGFKNVSWQFGMLIYYLFHRKDIFEGIYSPSEHMEVIALNLDTRHENLEIFESRYRFCRGNRRNLTVPDKNLDYLLGRCLVINPDNRIGMYEICKFLGVKCGKPLTIIEKLGNNTLIVDKPNNYNTFLAEMSKLRLTKNYDYSDCIPLAIQIHCRSASKTENLDIREVAIACLFIATKLRDDNFFNKTLDNPTLCRIENIILEACDFIPWSTTAESYAALYDNYSLSKDKICNLMLEGIWLPPLKLAKK